MQRKVIASLSAFVALLVVGGALAGKPSSSLSLVLLSAGDARIAGATAQPSYGGRITFDVQTTQADRPFVNVRCYQDGAFVLDGWHGFFASYEPDPTFTLASTYWTSGAADCKARLVEFASNGRERTLATTSFHVSA